ncbi:Flagellar FliJ protein [Marinomonas spartinae]|uniref:flagellar export protein FliJ n=1 Tax=Marinomonas spartinae TaxID=1792290 RepID=UPI0008090AD0|nr:flagellar export protein FliJ [Marinomonas spartinae]SBS26414.1 Flagellar FliJ protein [Marinomonas spartinae]
MKPKSQRVQLLIDLAKRKEEAIARQLANDRAKVEYDKNKLNELKEYAGQYESERNLLGLSPYLTTNYQHFVDRVQQAIHQQEAAIGRSEQQADMTMRGWQEAKVKTQSMDWLKNKYKKIEQAQEDRKEQQQNDELSMRRFFNNND